MKRALFLANLGTPDAPTEGAVRRYLREFLLDSRVVDIPAVMRWLLVHGVILRKRPKASAEAYQKIWTERGSPLLYHLQDLARGVREELGADWIVVEGMRYGNPSFRKAVRAIKAAGVDEIVFFPLYPQYSEAATGSSIVEFRRVAKIESLNAPLRQIGWFYDRPEYQEAVAHLTEEAYRRSRADYLLFSFHGLPERQLKREKTLRKVCFSSSSCCDKIGALNLRCYRAQCFATARKLAEKMQIPRERFSVSFQSRLGRTPWIGPYTDEILHELVKKGVRRLAVACPSFVADCLETLEEIAIRGRERFRELGGEDLILIPSLNSDPRWVKAVVGIVQSRS